MAMDYLLNFQKVMTESLSIKHEFIVGWDMLNLIRWKTWIKYLLDITVKGLLENIQVDDHSKKTRKSVGGHF